MSAGAAAEVGARERRPSVILQEAKAALKEREERHRLYPQKDDPESIAAIEAAGSTSDFSHAIELLTADGDIRGCQVNPDRAHLQALQNLLGWTIGGYDTRPVPESAERKQRDRLEILIHYRQPEDFMTAVPPRVGHYDYLCDSLFKIPMRPVSQEVVQPQFQNLEGVVVNAEWTEADWDKFKAANLSRPDVVFMANRYPYQVPEASHREQAHPWQKKAQHWVLWYFHFPWEPLNDPGDSQIDKDVRRSLQVQLKTENFKSADYIWYRNPGISVPEVFHVQVFWIVPDHPR